MSFRNPLFLIGRFLVILIALLWVVGNAQEARAQSATVRGFVTDESDGQALLGASVALVCDSVFVGGAATDRDGLYVISGVPAGRYTLRVSFIGFAPVIDTLDLDPGQIQTLNVALAPTQTELERVTVEEGRLAAIPAAGLESVGPSGLERVPSISADGDLAAYLTTLPGVVAVGDQGGQLFVRGGTASQNLILIDGIPVYQAFHLIGPSSIFPAHLVRQADVYAGGFPARYGERLSSVIDVQMRSGNKQRFAGTAFVDPLTASASVEGPILRDRLSLLASVRQSVIEHAAPTLVGRPLPFAFSDQFVKVHAALGKSSRVSVTFTHAKDRGTIGATESEPEANQITWENAALGGRYLLLPSALPLLAEVAFSASTFENAFEKTDQADQPERSASVSAFRSAVGLTYFLRAAEVRWGFFVQTSRLRYNLQGFFQNVDARTQYQTEGGGYLEAEVALRPTLRVHPGVRVITFPSSSRAYAEPRLRAAWDVGRGRISGAWGLYHQELAGLQDERDAGNVFTAWTPQPLAGATPRAMHAILGGSLRPKDALTLSAEGFYKRLTDLYIPEWNAFARFTTRLQRAEGDVLGLDLRAEVNLPAFYGFVGYGYSRTVYEASPVALALQPEGTSGTERFPPPHDRRHNLNVLGQITVAGFALSARWQFGSGLPYTRILGFDDWILLNGLVDVTEVDGAYRVIYDRRYRHRLPTYHRLDLMLERTFVLGKGARLTLKGGSINTYNRANLFYYDLFEFRRVNQLPLIPSLSVKLDLQ